MTQKGSVFCLEVSYGCDKEGRSGCPGDEKSLDGSFCSDLSTSNREGLRKSFTLSASLSSSVKWALSTSPDLEVHMRSSAGPDAWEPAGGSTGTWALGGPGGAGVSAPRQLPRCPFCRSRLSALPRPGRAGCQCGPDRAPAGGRRRARRAVPNEPGKLGASRRRRLPFLRAAETGTRA